MDLAANKALTIATAVFITIIITSGVLFSISQMQNIYAQVYKTDTNIQNRFSEYEAFENTTKTGIEVMNAAKKYRDSNIVEVYRGATRINITSEIERLNLSGEDLYKSYINQLDGKVIITFSKINI